MSVDYLHDTSVNNDTTRMQIMHPFLARYLHRSLDIYIELRYIMYIEVRYIRLR